MEIYTHYSSQPAVSQAQAQKRFFLAKNGINCAFLTQTGIFCRKTTLSSECFYQFLAKIIRKSYAFSIILSAFFAKIKG